MATLFRRRDEDDEANDVSKDVESIRARNDLPGETSLQEPGAKIWMPYLELADKYDKDLVHNWRDDMDSLLIFAALFSASVTAFVIESYNNLIQDTGEVTISVLLQISQQIANGTQAAAVRPSFQPTSIDIAVNILWFLSLAFSLTCALAAVLVRQWARQYLRFPRSFSSTSEQARARQFVFENMEWWKMDVIVEMIPALLHISLILFFVGLLLFVRSVNYTLAMYLLCFCAIGGAAYALLTTIPLVFSGCPYKTPFTGFLALWISGGTPVFRLILNGLAAFRAGVVVIFSSVPRFLAHRRFPSVNSASPTWEMEMSAPTTSHSERILARIPVTDVSSRDILPFFHNIRPSFQHFLHTTRSSFTLAGSSAKRAIRAFSVSFTERQQVFRDELTVRDAHALQWAMEYSKRDADLLDIVTSVPAFVESNYSDEVQMVISRSGVFPRAVRLLHSCAITNMGTNRSVCVACLESIIIQVSCSTEAIERDSHETDPFSFSSLVGTFTCDDSEPTQLQMDTDFAQLALCAISNVVLQRVYKLENSVKMTNDDEFKQQAERLISAISDIMQPLWRHFERFSSNPWQNFPFDHHLLDLGSDDGPIWGPSSLMDLRDSLQTFRSQWVTKWMKSHFSSSSGVHRLIWASLCDSTTHLQAFPSSTCESQHGIFLLTDTCFRMESSRRGVLGDKLLVLFSAYSMVLYGKQSWHSPYYGRRDLHKGFARSVRVYGGNQFGDSGDAVDIPFHDYTTIINELALFVPKSAWESQEYAWHYGDVSVGFLDASAVAIRKMIHCRTHDAARPEESILIDAQHLRAVRALGRYFDVWTELIDRTAAEFGYISQLDDDYNIDVHAELLFYDSGFPPCAMLESHEWSSLLGDWGCGSDPTLRPDVW